MFLHIHSLLFIIHCVHFPFSYEVSYCVSQLFTVMIGIKVYTYSAYASLFCFALFSIRMFVFFIAAVFVFLFAPPTCMTIKSIFMFFFTITMFSVFCVSDCVTIIIVILLLKMYTVVIAFIVFIIIRLFVLCASLLAVEPFTSLVCCMFTETGDSVFPRIYFVCCNTFVIKEYFIRVIWVSVFTVCTMYTSP